MIPRPASTTLEYAWLCGACSLIVTLRLSLRYYCINRLNWQVLTTCSFMVCTCFVGLTKPLTTCFNTVANLVYGSPWLGYPLNTRA